MLSINFLPESDLDDLVQPVEEYKKLWSSDQEKIMKAFEEATGYRFKETFINAVVYGRKGGQSHPLCLKGNCTLEERKAHLVHELGHRILLPRLREIYQKTKVQRNSLDNHKVLFLILYDVLEMVYGKGFADTALAWDHENLGAVYTEAWHFALGFKTKEERQIKFREMMAI